MAIRANGMALVTSLCLLCGNGAAAAQGRDHVPAARTICAAIDTTAPAPPAVIAPGQARSESDRLVAEAAALMAQPSRPTVSAAIQLLEQVTLNDPGHAVAFARLSDLGALFTLAGAALFYHSWSLLMYCAFFGLTLHILVLAYEEPTLRETFGPEYDAYCYQVPRWVPRF